MLLLSWLALATGKVGYRYMYMSGIGAYLALALVRATIVHFAFRDLQSIT